MEKTYKIGTVTIGQAPRTDITDEIIPMLGNKFTLIEKGALDNLSVDYINEHISPKTDKNVLVSRMADGSQVRIDKDKIIPLIQEKIKDLEKLSVDVILLLCNEKFPRFESSIIVVNPEEILHSIAAKLAGCRKVGVVMPDKSQLPGIIQLWKEYGVEIKAIGVSPYNAAAELATEAAYLADDDISFIFMECFGYSTEMKNLVHKITNKPVFITRTLIFKIIEEMF